MCPMQIYCRLISPPHRWTTLRFTVRAHTQEACYVCSKLPPSSTQVRLEARAMNATEAKCMASMGGVGYQHRAVTVKDADPYRPGLADGACDQLFWTNLNVTVKGRTIPQVAYTERPAGVNYTCYIQGLSDAARQLDRSVCTSVGDRPHLQDMTSSADRSTQLFWTRRRAVATFDPHDPVWGVNVPEDHKVWSAGDKVVLALFPQIGVGKLSLFIETLNYRFQSFVNLSLQVNDGQNRKIQAIRLMVLQNRMVLDLLTAAQGGVCHIIGTSCCTYIPGENDTHINDAMNSLKNLQQAMSNDKVPHQFDFFSWFFSGNWWQLLFKLLSPVLVVLVVLCSFTTCVIPCLKSAVSKFVSSTVAQVHIQLLRNDGCDDDDETWIA
ncbi:endogenous retrovirus group FC1 Env polyprotein-like [Syngnathus scovelli]|uniref:endogenous retrovirus group FC1 Env polyprotein-like n=1 Tax=Syngnathus scovelli TaxID=161590 RepID=UPI0021107884|nr:endogenous retrovirus group FC1 Env polyprotein-like isoform X1 [Syngnathus scovelli]